MTETHNKVYFCQSVFGSVYMFMFIVPVYRKEAGKPRCTVHTWLHWGSMFLYTHYIYVFIQDVIFL